MRLTLIALLFCIIGGLASADPVSIDGQGTGLTRDAAISNALISAVQQATGVTINATEIATTVAASVVSNHDASADIIQATRDQVERVSGGRVLSYRVEAVDAAPEGGLLARVVAQIEVYRPKGMSMANRRRVAVADFTMGSDEERAAFSFRDKLTRYLTQTRRFVVVDRTNDAAYAQEMAVVTGADAAPAERARAGQVLGADYVITGHLSITGARTEGSPATTLSHKIELTGEVVTQTVPSTLRTIPGRSSVDFEVIEIATRQVVFAGKTDATGSDGDSLALMLVKSIVDAIYPPRLIDISDPQSLILNEGGAGIQQGQRFRVMQEGQALIDPYTHESLGTHESQVAIIEIVEVAEKISYARLISGAVSAPAESLVLRPEKPAPQAKASATARKPAIVPRAIDVAPAEAPATGLKLPFDR
jgi:TolB-like protein